MCIEMSTQNAHHNRRHKPENIGAFFFFFLFIPVEASKLYYLLNYSNDIGIIFIYDNTQYARYQSRKITTATTTIMDNVLFDVIPLAWRTRFIINNILKYYVGRE